MGKLTSIRDNETHFSAGVLQNANAKLVKLMLFDAKYYKISIPIDLR